MRPEDAEDSAGQSIAELRQRVRDYPADAHAVLALARRLATQGEGSAARSLFQSILAGPESRQAQAQLALLDEDEGDWAAATAGWEHLLADDIEDKTAWAHLDQIRQRTQPACAPPASADQTLVEPEGVAWSRYELVREIGRGATSTVYLARDRTLGLSLALKVLHPDAGSSQDCQRFFAEARTVAGLRHPGVVAIYDLDPSTRTLVMEHLAGGSLRDHLAAARPAGLPSERVAGLARSLLATLDHVHAAGVVHGDITPRNILFRDPEQPVLADFGSARVLGTSPSELAGGTPLYLAPEQLAGEPSTPMTDLFSLGAVLWEALVGRPMRQHADLMAGRPGSRPLPDQVARLHPGLEALISTLTETKPDLRLAGARPGLG
jgi:hypothetical protein